MGDMQWQDLKGHKQSVFSLTIPPSTITSHVRAIQTLSAGVADLRYS
jgi:hypothetical protein